MVFETIKAQDYLERYGAQLSQQILTDMLENVTSDVMRAQIKTAVEDLNMLIQTDEKAVFLSKPKTESPKAPDFEKGCLQAWFFDDVVISYNKVASHFHGYRKIGDHVVQLGSEELRQYRKMIGNVSSL